MTKKRQNPLRILFFGASASLGTGYGLMIRNIAQRLNKREDMECYQLGLQTFGDPDIRYGFPVLPMGDEQHGADRLEEVIKANKINVLITFVDIWLGGFRYVVDVVKNTKVAWVCHLTVNASPVSPFLLSPALNADWLVTPSKFGEKEMRNAGIVNVSTVYHGIDTDVFKAYPEEEVKNIKEDIIGIKDKFVFLSIGRNQMMQKNYPALFYAYKIFLENEPSAKENTILHCHCNPTEMGGYDLLTLSRRHGIASNVFYTVGHKATCTFEPKAMAELYNYADCHVTCSHGESVSLPTLEAMSCGRPALCPDFSAMPEWINESGCGKLAKVKALWTTALLEDQCLIDEVDLAMKMVEIYKNSQLRKEMGEKGVAYIRSKFLWGKHIIPQWVKLAKKYDLEDYSDKPLVSVMMLSHNRKQWLGKAIDSVLIQTYKNFELVIVDNGSTDGSVEAIEEYAKKDPRIVVIKNDSNKGCPAARNQALNASKGKYIIFNDEDDVSYLHRIEKCVLFMEEHPDVDVMGSNSDIIDEQDRIHPSDKLNQDVLITFDMLLKEHVVNSPTACIRTDSLKEIGGFDESFDIASDRDIWLGLSMKKPIYHKNVTLMQYRVHTTNTSIQDPSKRVDCVNRILEKRRKQHEAQ